MKRNQQHGWMNPQNMMSEQKFHKSIQIVQFYLYGVLEQAKLINGENMRILDLSRSVKAGVCWERTWETFQGDGQCSVP